MNSDATKSLASKQSPTIRWLHLTDLHMGHKNESQRTATNLLLDAINKFAKSNLFDFVLITGDLTYSGQREEFDALEMQLIHPLKQLPQFANSILIAVPGNHDLDCATALPASWSTIGQSRQAKFFHLDESGMKTRAGRGDAFRAYSDFLKKNDIKGADPTREPAIAIDCEIAGRAISFISTVTSFFSDKEVSDREKAPAPTHPVRTLISREYRVLA